jgi:hypothetical protein
MKWYQNIRRMESLSHVVMLGCLMLAYGIIITELIGDFNVLSFVIWILLVIPTSIMITLWQIRNELYRQGHHFEEYARLKNYRNLRREKMRIEIPIEEDEEEKPTRRKK